MIRLTAWSLVAALILGTGVLTARVVGQGRATLLVSVFSNPDGSPCPMPCMFGIQPDYTPLDVALDLLRTHPLTAHLLHLPAQGNHNDEFVDGDVRLVVAPHQDESEKRGTVRYLSVRFTTSRPTLAGMLRAQASPVQREADDQTPSFRASLGQVIAHLGVPSRFQLLGGQRQGVSWLYFEDHGIVAQTRRLGGDYVEVQDELVVLLLTSQWSENFTVQRWRGFSNTEVYEATAGRVQTR